MHRNREEEPKNSTELKQDIDELVKYKFEEFSKSFNLKSMFGMLYALEDNDYNLNGNRYNCEELDNLFANYKKIKRLEELQLDGVSIHNDDIRIKINEYLSIRYLDGIKEQVDLIDSCVYKKLLCNQLFQNACQKWSKCLKWLFDENLINGMTICDNCQKRFDEHNFV